MSLESERSQSIMMLIASASHAFLDDPQAGDDTGIFRVSLELASGSMTVVDEVKAIPSCQYLNYSLDRRFVYATHYDHAAPSGQGSWVNAFAVDPASGALRFLNRQPAGGDSPCYVSTDHSGSYLLTVNYNGPGDWGGVWVFALNADGSIGEKTTAFQHDGHGVNPQRQAHSHPHMIVSDPSGQLILVPDLGIDEVMLYRLDQGQLVAHSTPWLKIDAGAGPRHLAFDPALHHLYVITELGNTISAFAYDRASLTFEALQTVTTLPADFHETSYCADIHVAPSGRFVYGSNRGHDSLAIYARDLQTGRLSLIGLEFDSRSLSAQLRSHAGRRHAGGRQPEQRQPVFLPGRSHQRQPASDRPQPEHPGAAVRQVLDHRSPMRLTEAAQTVS